MPIFWLILSIFWNVENTLPIFLKHSKFCSFIRKQSVWRKKRHVLGTFQFSAKSLCQDFTGVAIFWLILSIFWNVENTLPILLKHSKFCSFMNTISLRIIKACFGDFSIWTKIAVSGPYRCGHFLVDYWVFFEMLKIPFQFFWNIQNFVLSWKQSVWRKKSDVLGTFQFGPKSLYPDITGVAIFWLILSIFWNVENTLPILLKHSKFCSFMKTISLKKKKHIFGTFQFSAKSLCQDLTGVAFFWLILSIFWNVENSTSNSCETFKILFLHTNSVWRKKRMFLGLFNFDQNRCIWTLPVWPFFGWFWVSFEVLKIPIQFLWNIQNFDLSWKQSVWRKKRHVLGTYQCWTKIAVSGTYRRGHSLVDFEYFLKFWKYPSNSSETFKILFFHENNQFEEKKGIFWELFNSDQNRCIRTLPVWQFFGWFRVFFEMLKIPFQFFWNIQNFVRSWKQSVWRKKRHVLGTFQFSAKSLYTDLTGVAFFWLILSIFWNVENTLPIFLKHSNSVWRKKSMFLGLFNFRQNRCIRTLPAWQFFGWFRVFFYMLKIPFQFSGNIQNFVPILLKHSKFCSFMKTISLKKKKGMFWGHFILDQNCSIWALPVWPFFGWFWVFFEMLKIPFQFFWNIQNFVLSWKQSVWSKISKVFGTFQFSAKSLCQDLTGVAFFWLILTIFWNVENTLPILVKHSKFCSYIQIEFEEKNACFWDFSIFGKIAVSRPYRRGHFLVDFEYFLKCWKYPSNSSETFKILFFHEHNQFED